jgi:hypothetical protein
VATAEVSELRIFADLKYVDEFKDYDFSHQTMSIKQNVDRKKRYLSLEAWLKSEGKSTVVQYEFKTRIEGLDQGACDDIISGLLNALENVLGPSEPTSEVIHKPIPTPPWPLLVATAIGSTKPDHFNIWSPHERTPDIQQRHINKSNDHLNAYLAFSILAVE